MKEIFERRSIRKYKHTPVAEEDVLKIVKAGINAPSARNSKPFEFIIIDDRAVLDEMSERNEHARMLKDAPVAIAVCGHEATEFWPQDLAAATQNILLEATSLGLGTCWLGIYPIAIKEKYTKEILGVPEDVRVLSLIAVGYGDEEKHPNDKYDENIVHRNKW